MNSIAHSRHFEMWYLLIRVGLKFVEFFLHYTTSFDFVQKIVAQFALFDIHGEICSVLIFAAKNGKSTW